MAHVRWNVWTLNYPEERRKSFSEPACHLKAQRGVALTAGASQSEDHVSGAGKNTCLSLRLVHSKVLAWVKEKQKSEFPKVTLIPGPHLGFQLSLSSSAAVSTKSGCNQSVFCAWGIWSARCSFQNYPIGRCRFCTKRATRTEEYCQRKPWLAFIIAERWLMFHSRFEQWRQTAVSVPRKCVESELWIIDSISTLKSSVCMLQRNTWITEILPDCMLDNVHFLQTVKEKMCVLWAQSLALQWSWKCCVKEEQLSSRSCMTRSYKIVSWSAFAWK